MPCFHHEKKIKWNSIRELTKRPWRPDWPPVWSPEIEFRRKRVFETIQDWITPLSIRILIRAMLVFAWYCLLRFTRIFSIFAGLEFNNSATSLRFFPWVSKLKISFCTEVRTKFALSLLSAISSCFPRQGSK